MYKIDRKIFFGDYFYIFDIDCSKDGLLCFLVVNFNIKFYLRKLVLFMFFFGCYIVLEEEDGINFIYGKKMLVII